MMVHFIRSDFGNNVATRVCEQAIVAHIRSGQDRQRLPFPMVPHVSILLLCF